MSHPEPEAETRQRFAHRRRRSRASRVLFTTAACLAVALVVAIALTWPSAARTTDGTLADASAGTCPSAPSATACPASRAPSPGPGRSPTPSPTGTGCATPPAAGCPGASPSAHPTGTPTATPTSKPPAPRGGKPGPGNTGVPAGTHLTVVTGDQVYSKPNQTVSGLDIHGFVQIRAAHVTIKDSIIRGGPNPKCNSAVVWIRADADASATIEDSEIAPSYPSPCLDGIWATNATLERLDIHGAVDGVKAYDNVTLQDSYVHDLSWFANDPNQNNGPTHNDDVQTYEGNEHITLRHNTMSPGPQGNATYQVTQDGGHVSTDLHIVDNWLDGGGCTLNFSHKGGPTPMTGIYVVGNRFGRHSVFQCPILLSTQSFLTQNSGNVWDDTGKPIPPPQRHD